MNILRFRVGGLRCLRVALTGVYLFLLGLLPGGAVFVLAAEPEGIAVRSRSRIQELHLFTVPSALDLDGKPGPDAFEVRVYASNADKAKGIPITQGSLEIMMWDGVSSSQVSSTNKPLHIWSFKQEELKRNVSQTSLGIGYRLTLRWEQDAPKKDGITIVARFLPTKGSPVYSPPSGIAMGPK